MLEFEENSTKVEGQCAELRPLSVGTVTLSVSEYNDLLRRADAANNAIRLVKRMYSVHKPIEIVIDKHWLYQLAMRKLQELYGPDVFQEYEAVSCDDLVLIDPTLARLIKTKGLDL